MSLIKASGRTFVEELATNPQVNLMVVCERLGAPFNDGEAEISLAAKVAEKLYDRPQLVMKMLQQEAIEFLLQCWEMEGESLIAQMYLRELEQLHFLGFLSYEEDMTYDELEEFVMHRVVFWQSGILLRNQTNLRLIYASREVDDRNDVFIKWTINKDISWKIYSEDQYKELALSNGVGNWSGIPELFDFVMQNIEDDQYQAMMIVKSLVVKIQNGVTYTEITEAYTGLLEDNAREEQRTLCDLILKLYKTVPVYALKGHTREELEEEETGHRFQVIPGGKE